MFILSAIVIIFLIDITIYGISSGDWLTALSGGLPFVIAVIGVIVEKRIHNWWEKQRKIDPSIDRTLKEIEARRGRR